ncbi:MAG: potassium transporter TrkG [Chloroflexota bacterium]
MPVPPDPTPTDPDTALAAGPRRAPRELRDRRKPLLERHPTRRLLILFFALLAVGSVALMLPPMSATGAWTDPLTAFFTATSALTGTGLTVVSTPAAWSLAGQAVIMALVMVGGIGVMAGTVMVLVVLGRRADLRSRLMVGATSGAGAGDARSIVIGTARVVTIITLLGACVLAVLFFVHGGLDVGGAAWWGLFFSASAVNNAGFDLTGQSLIPYASDLDIVAVVSVLMLLGSLGVLALVEPFRTRRWDGLSVETRLVLVGSGVLVVAGALLFALIEWDNPATLGPLDPVARGFNSLFASISARSTGFNTVDIASLRPETQGLTMALMFVGGAVGSTAGGIRVNVLVVLVIVVVSMLQRHREPQAMGRRLEPRVVYYAITVTGIGLAIVGAAVFLMQLVVDSPSPAERSLIGFEVVSAFGTAGLSNGLTLGTAGQIGLILCMLLGRLSVLALAILFAGQLRARGGRPPRGIMRVA